ncbi:MAG: orotidine-5'-phosphate decarboxylase [Eggerthellaceae bacterium]|jgi:orotidine-5'-phosphate decarboxylase|nr:orotidine-5'-phosphate decarboxylase [Eggerthellaceae bacterium]MDR2715414.1 orotidine-5'-phosphate decarboxylase [Coriobacteriaceae bacterium]
MLSIFESQPPRERIIVALDCGAEESLAIADVLAGKAVWLKVGMTLFYERGPEAVRALKQRGFKVFLDLKFHDIPHQVLGAAASATASGADMLTIHAAGGTDMMRKAQEGAARAAGAGGLEVPATLGITVLTSMDDRSLADAGIARSLTDQVLDLARQAREAGLSGVVASPQEAAMLRAALGPEAYIVTPGVRPAGTEAGDQRRVTTPAQAFAAGASHIVVGRPITGAADPAAAFEGIVADIGAA